MPSVKYFLPFAVLIVFFLFTGAINLSFSGLLVAEDCLGPLCFPYIKVYLLVIVAAAVIVVLYKMMSG